MGRAITNGAATKFMQTRGLGVHHLEASVGVIRQSGEAAFMGGVLGAIHAKFGLDAFGKKVPMDGIAFLLLTTAGVALSGREVGTDLRNMGGTCISVLAFRKTAELFNATSLRGTPSASVAGEDNAAESGLDPIVAAARNL